MEKNSTPVLLPQPRNVQIGTGRYLWQNEVSIICRGESVFLSKLAKQLSETIWAMQKIKGNICIGERSCEEQRGIVLSLDPSLSIPEQGYRLSITSEHIHITSADKKGMFYGTKTLVQLLRQYDRILPACEIEDHPDFAVRGVMLDISRDKVPKLETLFALIDELAEWKINHLELYTEHTFAYKRHSEVWQQASPMTGNDILRLDAYCQERFIELVPNQNSFGHMERWLIHSKYNDLSECPDGFDCEWGHFDTPFSFDPTNKKCLDLLDEVYDELLPNFSSRKFNVGCDETVDLGIGKSKDVCKEKGKGRVYLEFLLEIYKRVKQRGRTMHFWGDIILKYPELVSELPRDITVMEWGYEADHPFDEHGFQLAQTGIPFYVCPGTSSWRSIAGRTDNCLGNLRSAAQNGLRHGAKGFLTTDWGDLGHWQYLPISYLGFAGGAALSWCYEANKDKNFIPELDIHVFQDTAQVMGTLAYDLGNAYRQVDLKFNSSELANILYHPTDPISEAITQEKLLSAREYIKRVLSPLNDAKINRKDGALIIAEFENAGRMLLAACDRGLTIQQERIDTPEVWNHLDLQMRKIMDRYPDLWIARNRIGGLSDSLNRLKKLLSQNDLIFQKVS